MPLRNGKSNCSASVVDRHKFAYLPEAKLAELLGEAVGPICIPAPASEQIVRAESLYSGSHPSLLSTPSALIE